MQTVIQRLRWFRAQKNHASGPVLMTISGWCPKRHRSPTRPHLTQTRCLWQYLSTQKLIIKSAFSASHHYQARCKRTRMVRNNRTRSETFSIWISPSIIVNLTHHPPTNSIVAQMYVSEASLLALRAPQSCRSLTTTEHLKTAKMSKLISQEAMTEDKLKTQMLQRFAKSSNSHTLRTRHCFDPLLEGLTHH